MSRCSGRLVPAQRNPSTKLGYRTPLAAWWLAHPARRSSISTHDGVNDFLPSPLIEKLASEGFLSRVERQPGGAWVVHFSRDDAQDPYKEEYLAYTSRRLVSVMR